MIKPIKVLCTFSTLDRGGAETMCMNLYKHIDRSKVQFDFVKHTQKHCDFDDEIESLGGKIYSAPRYIIYNHVSYAKWWRTFFQNHPEYRIIHGHYFTISAVYFAVAKKFGIITIGHSHATSIESNTLKGKIKSWLTTKAERYSDYCLACGKDAGQWLFSNKKYMVLPNAIDFSAYRFNEELRCRIKEQLSLSSNFVVGTVGSIKNVKNPIGVIDIFETLAKKRSDAKLLWIGDGPMRQDVEELLIKRDLLSRVIMTGVRDDVAQLLQSMDAFILPSFSEGLPTAAIEAQAAGIQCFISDKVTTECDITGRCHFLPLDNPELWADTIINTNCDHVDTKQQIIDAGYDIHTTAEWLQDFYLSILSNKEV